MASVGKFAGSGGSSGAFTALGTRLVKSGIKDLTPKKTEPVKPVKPVKETVKPVKPVKEGKTPSIKDTRQAMAGGHITPEQAGKLNPRAGYKPEKSDVRDAFNSGHIGVEEAEDLLGRKARNTKPSSGSTGSTRSNSGSSSYSGSSSNSNVEDAVIVEDPKPIGAPMKALPAPGAHGSSQQFKSTSPVAPGTTSQGGRAVKQIGF